MTYPGRSRVGDWPVSGTRDQLGEQRQARAEVGISPSSPRTFSAYPEASMSYDERVSDSQSSAMGETVARSGERSWQPTAHRASVPTSAERSRWRSESSHRTPRPTAAPMARTRTGLNPNPSRSLTQLPIVPATTQTTQHSRYEPGLSGRLVHTLTGKGRASTTRSAT